MKQKLPAILFILCTPISLFLFLRVSEWLHSDLLGIVAALALYMALALMIVAVFNKKNKTDKEAKK